jgi:hypothetical protein
MKKQIYFLGIFFLLLELCLISLSHAQPYTIWNKRYNSASNLADSAIGVAVNGNGQVFVTGWSINPTTGRDFVTIRYNPVTGDSIWVKRFVSQLDETPTAMTADNNFVYITGWIFEPSRDIITIKYNAANGDSVWVNRYNGSYNGGDYGLALTIDAFGNVYVTGRSDIGGSQKFTTLKYNAAGVQQWACVYTGGLSSEFDEAHAIKVDGSGNVYVTGVTRTSSVGDYLTLKINSSGVVQWAKKYVGSANGEDAAVDLELDASGNNVFVTGYSYTATAGYDYVTIKYSSNGDSISSARYNGTAGGSDVPFAMTIDASDNIYITGSSQGAGANSNYLTIKYSSNLVQQWVSRYAGGVGGDYASSIYYNSGFLYVTGSSPGSGTGYDYVTIKYNASTGAQVWLQRNGGTVNGNDYATSIAVLDSNQIFVTGSAVWGSPTGTDYYTIRYSQLVGIRRISENVPVGFELFQNYPNPFNPTTNIKFDVPKATLVEIFVYDMLGREVAILVNQKLEAGSFEVSWDASNYTSGIYFYKLVSGSYSETKKMILVK